MGFFDDYDPDAEGGGEAFLPGVYSLKLTAWEEITAKSTNRPGIRFSFAFDDKGKATTWKDVWDDTPSKWKTINGLFDAADLPRDPRSMDKLVGKHVRAYMDWPHEPSQKDGRWYIEIKYFTDEPVGINHNAAPHPENVAIRGDDRSGRRQSNDSRRPASDNGRGNGGRYNGRGNGDSGSWSADDYAGKEPRQKPRLYDDDGDGKPTRF